MHVRYVTRSIIHGDAKQVWVGSVLGPFPFAASFEFHLGKLSDYKSNTITGIPSD